MADGTKIEWTDATANVINGCSLASPGCTNCYAMRLAGTRMKKHPTRQGLTIDSKAGPVWTGEVRFHEPALQQVLRWQAPRRIFWNAHGDMFHANVPDAWIDRCFAAMILTPQHTHQVLTKRSARMREYVAAMHSWSRNLGGHAYELWLEATAKHSGGVKETYPARAAEARQKALDQLGAGLPNVWLGVSVEDQARADERIPDLLATPAAVRWISAEPLLGPVDLRQWLHDYGCPACGYGGPVDERCRECGWHGSNSHQAGPCPRCGERLQDDYACPECGEPDGEGDFGPTISGAREGLIDWIVVGGESGPSARPMHPDWASSLRDQCADAGVPFLFKQWGEWAPAGAHLEEDVPENLRLRRGDRCHVFSDHYQMAGVGKKAAGRLLDGVQHDGYPEVAHG